MKTRSTIYQFLPIIFIIALVLIFKESISQIPATIGNTNGTDVGWSKTIKNNTGQTANDLHFRIRQKEPWINCNGVTINGAGPFTQANGSLNDAGMGNGNHAVHVNLSGGDVPANGKITLNGLLHITSWNSVFIDSIQWTYDEAPIGGGGGGGGGNSRSGQKVNPPQKGGSGGGGGGAGGGVQEGNGGVGNFLHKVTIYNEDTIDHEILEFKLLASMTQYNLLNLDWMPIPPVSELGTFPILVPKNDSITYNFRTTGGFIGGHVYLKYIMASADTTQVSMDHPVEPACTFYVMPEGLGNIESTTGWPTGPQMLIITNMTNNIDYTEDVMVNSDGSFTLQLSAQAMAMHSFDAGDLTKIEIVDGEGDTLSYTPIIAASDIPTLTQWGLIIFIILFLAIGIVFVYKGRQ